MHATRKLFVIALIFSAATSITQAQSADLDLSKIDLRPNFTQGQSSRYQLWTHWSQTTASPAGSASVEYELNGETTWTVDKVNKDGSASCTMILDWLTMAFTGPDGKTMNMDSRKSKGDYPSVQKRIVAMTNTPIQFKVSADGDIKSVSGVKAINRKLDPKSSTFDDIDFIESAASLATLPGAPATLAVNKSWKMNYDWSHDLTGIPGQIKHGMRYTLESVEDIAGIPIANVTESSKLRYTPDLSDIPKDGPDVSLKMTKGSLDSQVMFDLQRHEAVGRNTVENHTFKFTIKFMGKSIVTTIDESIRSQLLRIEED